MAHFLNKRNLRIALLELFENADRFLILVSPFIKLTDEMKRSLIRKAGDKEFRITVVFGKNEDNLSKSLSQSDMEFFKQFQNVEIFYNQHLHAKYYANERASIITSLNLHQYSIEKNIEIGILLEQNILNLGKESKLETEIFEYIDSIKENSELKYEKRTTEEKFFFGLFKGETKQRVHYDATKEVYGNINSGTNNYSNPKSQFSKPNNGYCIRTGKPIPFNLDRPFSYEAFQSWSQYSNPDYKEKFCHYSGEKSDGSICFSKPVLRKYWSKVK